MVPMLHACCAGNRHGTDFWALLPVIQRDSATQAGVCGPGWLTKPFQTPSKRGDLATPVFKQARSTGWAVHSG